jgi:hypothetical protein
MPVLIGERIQPTRGPGRGKHREGQWQNPCTRCGEKAGISPQRAQHFLARGENLSKSGTRRLTFVPYTV